MLTAQQQKHNVCFALQVQIYQLSWVVGVCSRVIIKHTSHLISYLIVKCCDKVTKQFFLQNRYYLYFLTDTKKCNDHIYSVEVTESMTD
jgi:hypothetical protein